VKARVEYDRLRDYHHPPTDVYEGQAHEWILDLPEVVQDLTGESQLNSPTTTTTLKRNNAKTKPYHEQWLRHDAQ
jgi:hypothetical protein